MKLKWTLIFGILLANTSFSQNADVKIDYLVVMKQGYDLDYSGKGVRENDYSSFTLKNKDLQSFVNTQPIYDIQREYLTARTPYLQRVYRISSNTDQLFHLLQLRNEIQHIEIYEEPQTLNLPNDFYVPQGLEFERNTALDLIRAPMAWGVTQGSPSVLVGITDTTYEISHEDLEGQIAINLDASIAQSTVWGNHGTQVAGMFAKSNNGVGTASSGFNTKIAIASGLNVNQLLLLSQQPNVRVVNASWLSGCNYSEIQNAVIQEILNGTDVTPPVVVVAAAGNIGHCSGDSYYVYPASYPGVISVGGINHWQPRYGNNPNPEIGQKFWEDVYSIEPLNQNASNRFVLNDRIDVLAPGWKVFGPGAPGAPGTPGYSSNEWNGYWMHSGTSFASPITASIAALILSVNPNLSPAQVREIIKNTSDDIYQIPENQQYDVLENIGRLNAFRAVTTAKSMLESDPIVDLMIRDNDGDYGQEPNNSTAIFWNSPEIWVRNQPDGKTSRNHQNPIKDNTNYIYVRVYNRGGKVSSGEDILKIYWTKAGTSLAWPQNWDGSGYFPNNGPQLGNLIDDIVIPSLQPGEDVILELPWNVPNPEDYIEINPEPWHFCLLTRIESNDDPITFSEVSELGDNLKNNNNIALRNLTIISIPEEDNSSLASYNGVISFSNNNNEERSFSLEIAVQNLSKDYSKQLFQEAEISLKLDDMLFEQWSNNGHESINFIKGYNENTLLISDNNASLSNLKMEPNQISTINVAFNFLTKELLDRNGKFVLNVVQRDLSTNKIVGGETYNIEKLQKDRFYAKAGDNKKVDRNEVVTFSATNIEKEAVYNWYDENGLLIYSGKDLEVIADISKKYKLEIISLNDGLKDYDEVTLSINDNLISLLYPNPTSDILNLDLKINKEENNYIMITSVNYPTNISNYIVNDSSMSIDVSNYLTGSYVVSFIQDGKVVDSKIFIKN